MEERQARVAVEAGDDDAPADLAHAPAGAGERQERAAASGLPARGVTFGQKSYGSRDPPSNQPARHAAHGIAADPGGTAPGR